MEHDSQLPNGLEPVRRTPVPAEALAAAKRDYKRVSAERHGNGDRSHCGDSRLARLEKLADTLWDWSERVFMLVSTSGETPAQTAALAREAMSLGKGYAAMLETIDQHRAKQTKEG